MSTQTPDLFDHLADDNPPPPAAPPASPSDRLKTFDDGFDDGNSLALDTYAERAYLAYAMSVVRGRALPQVEDGLKPVQRRILHAMNEMRLAASAKHVKSARVVGDVIGKYHPHGDTSIYDAMVRVAQDFTLRYPLIDGQGNFGSRDGDGAAAMRYTECRLTPIAELLLAEIDRGTVDFLPNYDGSTTEPQLLPARLPFVLLNGASGIAVGMATEIPPHNLREVAEATRLLIKKPNATLEEVLAVLPGPDFPGGGQIISPAADIREMYANGRGSVRMRARWRVEELARGQWRVVVYELPHGVSVAQVLSEIESLTNPQPRAGKKDLGQEQRNLKALVLGVLDTVRDESSDQQAVRIVLEPKSSRLAQDEFMGILLAHTSLESNVSVNLTMMGLYGEHGGRPRQKNLLQILREWVAYRFATVERRTRHRLAEVERRMHILEGRMLVFLRIDEVIRCIREADDPKADLIARFGLTEIQAEDILDIRLRQLARLEGIRIEKELNELRKEHGQLITLLESRAETTRLILKEISEDAKRFGDDRRTLMQAESATTNREVSAPDEPVTVIISKNGWVRVRQGHEIDPATLTYKAGDSAGWITLSRTIWPLVIIDDNGRSYSLKVADLPSGRGDGAPLNTLLDFQEGGKLAQVISAMPEDKYLIASSGAYGFITRVADMMSRNKAGKVFLSLEKGERPLSPAKVGAGNTPHSKSSAGTRNQAVAALSESGRLLIFALAELKEMARGRGLMLLDLAKNDALAGVAVVEAKPLRIQGIGRAGKALEALLEPRAQAAFHGSRARRGQEIPFKLKPTGLIVDP
ncbi:DNA topoisomerase IV subunit A [Rugosibacter aromaticivorans]|uniref:DNA topoisomerase 4 subunit A n=1 Tax=Rugosibacter aromaticivorans TaxID=1565605 RepID=A0A0C5J9Y7_9PROT|nr:DNA topoisomerase IV subunit A [Rugosibacter aromaticivorans]AJP48563.1 DNA topoisomerase IV subunit A [Rugosibacter aromaticivorans]TBR13113.1 MAG: DNA topoisomerase IV subunit A [Rugosibacter sp.]